MNNGMLQTKLPEDKVQNKLSQNLVHSIGMINGLSKTKLSKDPVHNIGMINGML